MRVNVMLAAVVAVASISVSGYDKVKATIGKHVVTTDNLGMHADEHEQAEHGDDGGGEHHASHRIIVTSPVEQDVTTTQQYVCQIHSSRHIEVRALQEGYLEAIKVNEGQTVEQGQLMFKILPVLYQARLESDVAEAQLAQVEYDNTQNLVQQNVLSVQELKLAQAKLSKAQANVKLAQAEKDFTEIKAPFDGIVNRQEEQLGSLIEVGDILTTLSDNSVMWVYFNVPEARYIEYKTSKESEISIELKLAGGTKFSQPGTIGAIEADFNNETGNIAFRADFANPDLLLRHGQTGTVLIHRVNSNAVVIPQRATFEILAKKYAYVVGEDGVVRQREIVIENELDDIYLIKNGLDVNDKIVFEGIRQVRDGEKVEYEFEAPEKLLANLKNHAE